MKLRVRPESLALVRRSAAPRLLAGAEAAHSSAAPELVEVAANPARPLLRSDLELFRALASRLPCAWLLRWPFQPRLAPAQGRARQTRHHAATTRSIRPLRPLPRTLLPCPSRAPARRRQKQTSHRLRPPSAFRASFRKPAASRKTRYSVSRALVEYRQ